jgi:hypothetical protein
MRQRNDSPYSGGLQWQPVFYYIKRMRYPVTNFITLANRSFKYPAEKTCHPKIKIFYPLPGV